MLVTLHPTDSLPSPPSPLLCPYLVSATKLHLHAPYISVPPLSPPSATPAHTLRRPCLGRVQRDNLERYQTLIERLGIRDSINLMPPRVFLPAKAAEAAAQRERQRVQKVEQNKKKVGRAPPHTPRTHTHTRTHAHTHTRTQMHSTPPPTAAACRRHYHRPVRVCV
jgi:hypothetical protein